MTIERRSLILGTLLVGLVGCAHQQWQVVSQANPNPLLGQKQFAVAPLDFSKLTVGEKTEEGYLSEKNAEDKAGWAEAKAGLQEEFNKSVRVKGTESGLQLSLGETGAPFIIKPKVDFIEPGFYALVAAKPSQVKMTISIVAPDGSTKDEILVENATGASMGNASAATRLREDGEALGEYVAKYLSSRVAPAK